MEPIEAELEAEKAVTNITNATPVNNTRFDDIRKQLANECVAYREAGLTLLTIAGILNERGQKTKTGRRWAPANVCILISNPEPVPPKPASKKALHRRRQEQRTIGVTKLSDKNFSWIREEYPQYEQWRLLGSRWANGIETGVQHAIQGVNAFVEYIQKHQLPANPPEFLLASNHYPDFYQSKWGIKRTHASILINNTAYYFIEWVLSTAEFCEEDDFGRLKTSPAFRNPLEHLSRSGIARHPESVRTTLPYGYIEELRQLIAQGSNFRDWKWAHDALGTPTKKKRLEESEDEGEKIAPIWFEVDQSLIDHSDPDCVWRERIKVIASRPGRRKEYATVLEMWSPVRWVALLIKLLLPLRTLQVRMLDSGEADTWRWEKGSWSVNTGLLAKGTEARPYTNGVFLKPRELSDVNSTVLLHINTNKTADIGKDGNHKGYNVPWVTGGRLHQDPYYWLEKLRAWQEKYNPLQRLTPWTELDGRHVPVKSEVQLAGYPDTAFLFRTPENKESPHFPLTQTVLNAPWYWCLSELEQRLWSRGERLPGGGTIRLIPERKKAAPSNNSTLFPLHGLRVSLITALALDGEVPLAILQKIAGHSRLVMTLYYTKPGAKQTQQALQAGVERLNESANESIVDWMANAEYTQLVKEAITNSPASLRAAVSVIPEQRLSAGWMVMVDGLCLAGGNTSEVDSAGCHNGGPNISNESAPRYSPVPGGARNCPRCRWFVTRPSFLPQLAARWNNVMYHCNEARAVVISAEEKYQVFEELRADALSNGQVFTRHREYLEAERVREQAIQRFDELTMTVSAITRLIERCRIALTSHEGTALVAAGTIIDIQVAVEETDSELLQLSGICEGAEIYPDLEPGKAVLRRSQLLDAALRREQLPPTFLLLSEEEQKLIGNAFLRELAVQMNRENPALGRYQVISLIDAGKSLTQHLGVDVSALLRTVQTEKMSVGSSVKFISRLED